MKRIMLWDIRYEMLIPVSENGVSGYLNDKENPVTYETKITVKTAIL